MKRDRHTVVAVTPRTLLLGIVVSNMIWFSLGGIAFGIVGLVTGTLGLYGFGILLGAAGMLWKEVAGNWGFVLSQSPDGLHLSRGLTSRSSQSVRPDRIQGVLIQQAGLLHRQHASLAEDFGQQAAAVARQMQNDQHRRRQGGGQGGQQLYERINSARRAPHDDDVALGRLRW